MTIKFFASKNVLNIVEFDKTHQLWRICANNTNTYTYEQVKKVSMIETLEKNKRTSNILNNIAATMSAPVSFAQPSASVKIQIKIILKNDEEVIFDISNDYIPQNSLDYHADKRKAEEIKKAFKILAERNRNENNY